MSNTGVFGLSGYNDKNLEGLIPDKTRESYREYGYFGGGGIPFSSIIDRIDYSNDTTTASVRSKFTYTVFRTAGSTGNSNFGYFGGGRISSQISRINYSNDTQDASIRSVLSSSRYYLAATGNSNFGYFGGGQIPGPTFYSSVVDRLDYSNDISKTISRGPLNTSGRKTATGNSNFGYFGTGSIDRINYSNDLNFALIRGSLNITRDLSSATGNSNFGYFGGGSTTISSIERIDYSNDTSTASVRGPLSAGKNRPAATGNSNFGYFGGGSTPAAVVSTVDRIDYSNDTQTASVRGPLSSARYGLSATSSASFGGSPISQYGVFAKPFGYFGGGFPNTSAIDRIDYTNDTSQITTRNNLSLIRYALAATGNQNFGYFGGGLSPGPSSTVDRIDYSNDASAVLTRGPLSSARYALSATGNSNFGYFVGGMITGPTVYSTVDRIDYSNDNTKTLVRGSLSTTNPNMSATGTSNFGYFGGGRNLPVPANYSKIERIDYSNDNAIALVRSQFLTTRRLFAATGNSNFGYFGGGTAVISTVDRLDYSSDTTTASTRGPLSLGRRNLTATGNFNFGYFGGGNNSPSPGVRVSTIDRVDYANDTETASVRGPLSSAKYFGAATSPTAFGGAADFTPTQTFFDIQSMKRIEDTTNASVKKRALGSYGYFGGGDASGAGISTIDRIDYSNDTSIASARNTLNLTRTRIGATGNSNFGYFGGGNIVSPFAVASTIDRLDYSNDSSGTLVRAIIGSGYKNAVSNSMYGWFMDSTGRSLIERIDFSNDLLTGTRRGQLSRSVYYIASTGNSNFGYFGGGLVGVQSTIDRIDYSNDNQTSSVRGPLSIGRYFLSATGNSNFGYFMGGVIDGTSPGRRSTVDRVDYTNDTTTASVRGPLASTKYISGSTGNSNFGYIGGGVPGVSTLQRIDYSNDTAQASPRGFLSIIRTRLAATTNARNS